MLVNENVEPPPERRVDGIGPSELGFVAGFLMAAAGLAMVWLPLGAEPLRVAQLPAAI